jgi:hypothetical protein
MVAAHLAHQSFSCIGNQRINEGRCDVLQLRAVLSGTLHYGKYSRELTTTRASPIYTDRSHHAAFAWRGGQTPLALDEWWDVRC